VKRPPRLYFSFRSPYSWMAVHRLRRTVPDLFEVVDCYPYWDPDPDTEGALLELGARLPYQAMSKAKHLYVLGDTKRLATRLGLAMAWPIDIDPWWEVPHLAWLAARRLGVAVQCYDALVAARWQRGENICERAVLRRVTAEAGLPADLLDAAVDDAQVRAEGVRCLYAAYEDDIFGVPYLRLGRQRFWGFDRLELFLEAYRDATGAQADPLHGLPVATVPAGGYDRDTAGGCG
jgi:2-hydroxychromene-2-carboxylate isomerase